MSDDIAISVQNVSKAYRIWRDPSARLEAPISEFWQKIVAKSYKLLAKASGKSAPSSKLQASSFSPYFKDFYALKDVSFVVKKGEAVGIIGRNGSGKSTLLQIIAGTLTPTTGQIKVKGRVAALLELGSGFNPDFTGRENVYLNASVLGLTREEIDKRIDEILAFADIGDFIDQPVKTYSSGMMMRLAFAVQIAVEPDILIVDEALGVGDEAFQRKCFTYLERLRERGTTLLFVSHDAGTIVSLCNCALWLEKGRLLADGKPKEVVTAYQRMLYSPKPNESGPAPVLGVTATTATELRFTGALAAADVDSTDESFYDPSLASAQPIVYESGGGTIEKVEFLNARGEPVNQLTHGSVYRICVNARFHRPCFGVFFGSMISTLHGVAISGVNTPTREQPIPFVEAGKGLIWSYSFTCRLLPGAYAVEIGIGGLQDDNPSGFIHRIVDAFIFKVQPLQSSPVSGLVELDQHGKIESFST